MSEQEMIEVRLEGIEQPDLIKIIYARGNVPPFLSALKQKIQEYQFQQDYAPHLEVFGRYAEALARLPDIDEANPPFVIMLSKEDAEVLSSTHDFYDTVYHIVANIQQDWDRIDGVAEVKDKILHDTRRVVEKVLVPNVRSVIDDSVFGNRIREALGITGYEPAPDPDGLGEGGYTNDPRNAPGGGGPDKSGGGRSA